MKLLWRGLILIILAGIAGAAFSQTKPVVPSEVQKLRIENAIKDFQIASMKAQTASQAAQNARVGALNTIEAVRIDLKLDATWQYNEQTGVFEKKAEVKK